MVRIRLSRIGKVNRPYWRIVVIDSRDKRDGAFIDNLGSYDPIRKQILNINLEGINGWVAKGAQCSDSVKRLIKQHKKGVQA